MNFDELREELSEKRPGMTLFILDACRDNPYKSTNTRSLAKTRGLAKTDAAKGTFIMYSAAAGEEALDSLPDDGPSEKNSVYTRRLIPLLTAGDLGLQQIALRVRTDVRELAAKARRSQTPAYYDGLNDNVCLSTECAKSVQAKSKPIA